MSVKVAVGQIQELQTEQKRVEENKKRKQPKRTKSVVSLSAHPLPMFLQVMHLTAVID